MNESIISLVINTIIDREGGYVDHPADLGGPTKYGITIPTLEAHVGITNLGVDDIRGLTRDEAYAIYLQRYVVDPEFTAIADPLLFEMVVDAGVHSGPRRAVKWLQRALEITDDGVIGPVTRDNLIYAHRSWASISRVRARFMAERIRFIGEIITDHPANVVFAKGWLSRAGKFVEAL